MSCDPEDKERIFAAHSAANEKRLLEAVGGDEDLANRVRGLLAANNEAWEFLMDISDERVAELEKELEAAKRMIDSLKRSGGVGESKA